jgi:ATP-dependent DNA helicase RecG
MGHSPFTTALEALLPPLRFAARDDFAHASRVRDLEDAVSQAARRAAALALPDDLRSCFARVARAFEKPLEGEARAAAIRGALEVLEPMAAPEFSEGVLSRSSAVLPGIGPKRAESLLRRGLASVGDLLFHLPTRYDDRRSLARIADLEVGRRATFLGRVVACDFAAVRTRGGRFRRTLEAVVEDDTGSVKLCWFHGGDALRGLLAKRATLLVTGDVRRYRFAKQLLHPEIERLDADPEGAPPDLGGLREVVPDYPAPEGLHPRALRRAIQRAVRHYADLVDSVLPESLARERKLPPAARALVEIHCPGPEVDVEALRGRATPAHERLVLEELFLLEAGLALRRAARAREPGIEIAVSEESARTLARELPFRLTAAQQRVWREIHGDLSRPHPMNRLLQGDVGSGKTAVAFLAARAAAAAGHQSALMAPTELLAEQHQRTLCRLLERVPDRGARPLRLALLTASVPRADADAVRRAVAAGEVDLVVGTHALVQRDTRFARLALAIVDEQHRFGVMQRAALAEKTQGGVAVITSTWGATPIPRTLALTLYGDLDLSVIDELPAGRRPVTTELLRGGEGARVMESMRAALGRGDQVYVVYPLVEESEKLDLRAASESFERIRAAFPECRVDLLHGRLSASERGQVMARFERGEAEILVSTTVVEVGVDVENAALMIVEHAERFGLAQLHQLRGRVGRGTRPGHCILVARGSSDESEARLRAMLETTDGFRIADADLRIRGPGEFLGTRQSGRLPDLHVADLLRDARWIAAAREAALEALRRDPGLRRDSALRRAVERRWGDRLALSNVG